MAPFTRPELVIRRCDELLSVGQPLAALQTISEVFSSKKFRSTPVSVLEPILVKFLSLCVDLRKGRTAREGLQMYKNVVQNTSVSSVELVIKEFVKLSSDKLKEAIAKVDELEGPAAKVEAGAEVEDLEATETPESLLLSAVSEEKSRDRTYRTLVTPWLRFLWEAYRTALDVLRNNMRLEVLYQEISHSAFKFCIEHGRKTEFRRLCEMLRSHLSSSQKGTKHPTSINLNDPETLQRYLDTRFQQLNTAVDLELWQEAFRTAEDIHGLIGMSKRLPKASMMAQFYDKMVKVFGVGQNYLFHAAAYGKLYSLHAQRAAVSGAQAETAELAQLSSLVLLSALAVPLGASTLGESTKRSDNSESDGSSRVTKLAALIGLPSAPTRSGLITEALNRHVLKRVSPELRSLYNILEVDFHPLSITKKIEPILASLAANTETARYVEPLKEVVLARLFQQLGQVYASLKIERVVRLASFAADGTQTRKRVERFMTEACRRGDLDVTIDHASGSIKFDQDLFGTDDGVSSLQPSASTLLRTHLARLANTLYATLDLVSPAESPLASASASRALAFTDLETKATNERNNLMARTQIIKRRKELADEQTARIAQAEAHERTVRAQQKAEEDARRAQDDARNKQLALIKKEREAKEKKEAEELAKKLADSGLKIAEEELKEMNPADLGKMAAQQIEKDKKELAAKLTSVTKRIDYLERAFRKEEIPLLQEDYQRQQARDRDAHVTAQAVRAEAARKQHAEDVGIKKSLARIMGDYHAFKTRTEAESRAAYEQQAAKLAEQLEEAKAARREEYRIKAERDAEAAREAAAAAEAKRIRDEALAREEAEKRAEEERYAAEHAARQAAMQAEAEAKRKAALEERIAQRAADQEKIMAQQKREEEALARRQNGLTPPAPGGPAPIGSAAWKAQRDASSSERPRMQLAPRSVSAAVDSAPSTPIASPGLTSNRPSGPPVIAGAGGAKPSWREREAQRAASGIPPASNTPPPPQPRVASEGSWSARRTGEGERPPPSSGGGGAYRPPGRR